MSTTETRKRKRKADPPRVTFTTPGRTFERLLKEPSLDVLRSTVIKKLGIDSKTPIEFSQVRSGRYIDLEDEDDFEAFKSYATSNGVAEVRVTVSVGTSGSFQQTHRTNEDENHQVVSLGKSATEPSIVIVECTSIDELTGATLQSSTEISQTNGVSELRGASPSESLVRVQKRSKQKTKHTPVQESASVPTVEILSKSATGAPNVSSTKEMHAPESKLISKTPPGPEAEKSNDGSTGHGASLHEEAGSTPPVIQQSDLTSKQVKAGKEKKSKEKRTKKKAMQGDDTVIQPTVTRSNGVAPTSSTTTPPEAPGSVSEPPPSETPHEPKKRNGNKRQVSEPVRLDGDNRDQSQAGPPTTTASNGTNGPDQQLQVEQSQPLSTEVSSPPREKPKRKKRKLEPETSSSKPGKSKKRKATGNGALSTAGSRVEEPQIGQSEAPGAKPADVKSKATGATKRAKTTQEEDAQYDKALEDVIAKMLAKRMSASSGQTVPIPPVPTIVSSAPSKDLITEHPEDLGMVDADDISSSKGKREKRKKKARGTDGSAAAHPSSKLRSVPPEAVTRGDLSSDDPAHREKGDQHAEDGAAPDLPVSRTPESADQMMAPKRLSNRAKSPNKVRNAATARTTSQSGSSIKEPKTRTSRSTPTVRNQEAMREAVVLPVSRNTKQSAASEVPVLLPPGLNVPGIIEQGKDEGSSSGPSSDPGSTGTDSMDTVVPSNLESNALAASSYADTTAFPVPSSSFTVDGPDVDQSTKIEDLLHPKDTISWRSITRSDDNGGDEQDERMSDVEEEVEEVYPKKAPRNSLSMGHAVILSSDEEDIDEDDDSWSRPIPPGEESDIASFYGVSLEGTATQVATVATTLPEQAEEGREGTTNSLGPDTAMEEPGPNSPDLDSVQSQLSPPLPSLRDVSARGESVFTGHVADVAFTREDTLLLVNVGKLGQEAVVNGRSVADEGILKVVQPDPSESQGLIINKASISGQGTNVLQTTGEFEARSSTPVPPTSRLKKPMTRDVTNTVDTTAMRSPLRKTSLNQTTTTPTESESRGWVKRMGGRRAKKVETGNSLLKAPPVQDEELSSAVSAPVNLRRGQNVPQESQSIDKKEFGTSQPVRMLRSRAVRQQNTMVRTSPTPGSEGTIASENCGVRKLGGGPNSELGTGAPRSSQANSLLSQPTRNKKLPHLAASIRNGNDSVTQVQGSITQQGVREHPSPLREEGSDNNGVDPNSASTTEVERSLIGGMYPTQKFLPSLPVNSKDSTERARSPTRSASEEEEEEEDDEEHTLAVPVVSSRPLIAGMRSLQSIASNPKLFSPASTPRSSLPFPPVSRCSQAPAQDGNDDDDNGEDDSYSSSSDSDGADLSTIPEGRRAGSAPARPKKGHIFMLPFF